MKLAEMLLYDVPNVKLDHFQVDVYTSFRDESGHAEPRCILSTLVRRSVVEDFDWENDTATSFVELNDARFDADRDGAVKSSSRWTGKRRRRRCRKLRRLSTAKTPAGVRYTWRTFVF